MVEGLCQTVDVPAIGVRLALAEIYDGVVFPADPRLVRREGVAQDPERFDRGQVVDDD